jgi:hypothetical protein
MARAQRISKRRRVETPAWRELSQGQWYALEFAVWPLMDWTPEEALDVWRSIRRHYWSCRYRPPQGPRYASTYIRPPALELLHLLTSDFGVPFDLALRVAEWGGKIETAPTLEDLEPAVRDALLSRLERWRESAWSGRRVAP